MSGGGSASSEFNFAVFNEEVGAIVRGVSIAASTAAVKAATNPSPATIRAAELARSNSDAVITIVCGRPVSKSILNFSSVHDYIKILMRHSMCASPIMYSSAISYLIVKQVPLVPSNLNEVIMSFKEKIKSDNSVDKKQVRSTAMRISCFLNKGEEPFVTAAARRDSGKMSDLKASIGGRPKIGDTSSVSISGRELDVI